VAASQVRVFPVHEQEQWLREAGTDLRFSELQLFSLLVASIATRFEVLQPEVRAGWPIEILLPKRTGRMARAPKDRSVRVEVSRHRQIANRPHLVM
jgi:hypothetical protein